MHSPALRILDANLNRAREGLRTAEEFARMVVSDVRCARALKTLRHDLDLLFRAPALHQALLAARHVAGDVGAGMTLPAQKSAHAAGRTPREIAAAALKRAAEALRNLEEYLPASRASSGRARGKSAAARSREGGSTAPGLLPAPAAVALIRYALYDLERDLFLTRHRAELLQGRVLCLLWSPDLYRIAADRALSAALAGARDARRPDSLLIQLRVKSLDDGRLLKLATATRRLCEKRNLPLILNDRPHVALHAGCAGVHLGQTDLPPALAREMLGPAALIGLSTHSAEQIRAAALEPIDYIGLGPMFATTTKAGLKPQGPALAKTTRAARRELNLPVFAIGGITAQNLPSLCPHGITAAAVSSAAFASCNQAKIRQSVARLLRAL